MDYEAIDKEMSRRVDAVYSDPARHKFYSVLEAWELDQSTGPRGGKIILTKQAKTEMAECCFHCGRKAAGHAAETEKL